VAPKVIARLGNYIDLPAQVYNALDNARAMTSTLEQHDQGQLQRSAMLWTSSKRSARIRGVIGTRRGALVNLPREFKATKDRRLNRQLCEFWEGKDGQAGAWDRSFPDSDIGSLSEWGFGLGVGIARVVWDRTEEWKGRRLWMPSMQVFDPQFAWYRTDEHRFYLNTISGQVALPRPEEDSSDWFVWTPYGYHYGWRSALIRALGPLYIDWQWNRRDWSRRNEVHGQPIRKAITGAGVSSEDKDEWFNIVQKLGSETVVTCEIDENGKFRYDIQLVEAMANNHETFEAHLESLNNDIAIVVLGQALTTQMQGGGSRAAAQVGDNVTARVLREDASLIPWMGQRILRRWAELNFGDPDLAPSVRYKTEPPADNAAEATVIQTLGAGLAALDDAADGAIDTRAVLEKFGVPMLSPEDQEAKKAEKMARAQQMAASGPGGVDVGDGGDDGGNSGGGAPPGDKPEPGKDDGANADGQKKPPKKKSALSTGARESDSMYPVRVAKSGARAAAKANGAYLKALTEAVQSSSSAEEARKKVLAIYKDAKPAEQAKALARARLMANLAGRETALVGL
jgi:phage gp29-like protein